ncbi:hypothetical protein BFJ72_g6853 [Fusarium proliferatum]|uniref:Uncharacterized protein n=1 Tax=Gibberella intermedia TaxID=948311 RepID=A0A420TD56_GIBIN|nr:hypothetical protein BFJ72_g6853 [Fusarium proliferatum]
MARKRFRKPKKQGTSTRRDGPVWSNSHRLELLAFLNWSVQQDKGPDFYTLVADHLKRATKKSFTKVQIRKKLNHEWHKHGMCDQFIELYTLGTAGLRDLSAEDQRELDLISLRLDRERPKARRFLRSSSLAPAIQSRSRPTPTRRFRAHRAPSPPPSRAQTQVANSPKYRTKSQTRYFLQRKDLEDNLIQSGFPEADSADVTGGDVGQLSSPPSIDSEPNDVGTILASEPPPRPSIEAKLRMELLKAKGREFTMMNQISELERERYDRDQNKRAGPLDPNAARGVISRLQKQVNALQRLDDEFELLEYERFAFMGSSLGSECRRLY